MRAQEFTQPRAAGCIVVAEDTGRWCLQQRSDTVSNPGVWSTWGGGVEPGETLEQAVRRELAEEGGYIGDLTLEPLHQTPQYATFIARVPTEFEPKINHESKDWCWVQQDQLPEPLHPELKKLLSNHLHENVYDVLDPVGCGPFDGGCVLVAQALQQIHGGRIVVLVDDKDRAQHAAVYANGQLIDYEGAADPKTFVRRFERNEHTNIHSVRPMRDNDLVDAPRNQELIPKLVKALSENFNDGKKPGRKGLAKRVGVNCKQSVSKLRSIAKNSSGERQRMAHWCANMKSSRNK